MSAQDILEELLSHHYFDCLHSWTAEAILELIVSYYIMQYYTV